MVMSKKKKKPTESSGQTVGEVALQLQASDEKINPIDLQREVHKGHSGSDSFETQVLECLNRGAKEIHGSFFIVVLFKKERLLHNIVRQYFFYRRTCPTPEFDQIVYKYDFDHEKIDFVWVIPDKASCHALTQFVEYVPIEHLALAQYAKDFLNGNLDRLCAKLNGENYNG